jgi:hypothetical protein
MICRATACANKGRLRVGHGEFSPPRHVLPLRQVCHDVLALVPLTALDHGGRAEHLAHSHAEALGPIEEPRLHTHDPRDELAQKRSRTPSRSPSPSARATGSSRRPSSYPRPQASFRLHISRRPGRSPRTHPGPVAEFCLINRSIFDSLEHDPGIPCESRSVQSQVLVSQICAQYFRDDDTRIAGSGDRFRIEQQTRVGHIDQCSA